MFGCVLCLGVCVVCVLVCWVFGCVFWCVSVFGCVMEPEPGTLRGAQRACGGALAGGARSHSSMRAHPSSAVLAEFARDVLLWQLIAVSQDAACDCRDVAGTHQCSVHPLQSRHLGGAANYRVFFL